MEYLVIAGSYTRKLACETDRFRDENDVKSKKTKEEEGLIHFDDRHTTYDVEKVSNLGFYGAVFLHFHVGWE